MSACKHCDLELKLPWARGLCQHCYLTPDIRERYPILRDYAARPLAAPNVTPPPPEWATDAPPGSEEKQLVMMARVESGRGLYHPQDRPLDLE